MLGYIVFLIQRKQFKKKSKTEAESLKVFPQSQSHLIQRRPGGEREGRLRTLTSDVSSAETECSPSLIYMTV